MERPYSFFSLLHTAFIVAMMLAAVPVMAASDSAFTVKGVKVDVTADSAAAAREQAFAQAQQAAFRQLADRLLSDAEMAMLKIPDTNTITSLINDFEITDEQLSSVEYIATYTFRFKKDAVRNFLGGSGLSYTDVSSKPVLILPYYQWGSRTVLWGNDNPWLAAWTRAESQDGLVPVTVPIGDVQDVSDMGDDNALTFDAEALSRMTERYGAGEAIIMIAAPVWGADQPETHAPAEINVMIYRTADGAPEMSQNLKVTASADESAAILFDRAAQEAQKTLQKDWKDKTLVSADDDNNLQARVKFSSMPEWIETQKKLRRVQGVLDVRLMSIMPRQAHIELVFKGKEDRLRLALAQADMTLTAPLLSFGAAGSPLVYDLYLNKFKPR